MSWSKNQMDVAIEKFRIDGNYSECLRLIGAGRDPLLTLQYALGVANRRAERDALEDISFSISKQRKSTRPCQKFLTEIIQGVKNEYGHLAVEILEPELPFIVSGILHGSDPIPPLNSIIAIIGIAAEQAADLSIDIDEGNFGNTSVYFSITCDICGGKSSGEGYIICERCLANAREKFNEKLEILRLIGELPNNRDVEPYAREYLIANPDDFGCEGCRHNPVKRCECAREVAVPKSPRDGEIVRGRYLATDNNCYFCIRLKQERVAKA